MTNDSLSNALSLDVLEMALKMELGRGGQAMTRKC